MAKAQETQYKIIKARAPEFPPRDLIEISSEDRNFVASAEAFGPTTYSNNLAEMQKPYSHPETGKRISFREPTTVESVLIASCDFEKRAKPQIFNPCWLQAGRILRAGKFVYAGLPRDKNGAPITDEKVLEKYLSEAEKVNGIFLLPNGKIEEVIDFGAAPYSSFEQDVQTAETFAAGGLARLLEHTTGERAENLFAMASTYPNGVNVIGFDSVKTPVSRVASLGSYRGLDDCRLYVGGYCWGGCDDGCAFGVLNLPEK